MVNLRHSATHVRSEVWGQKRRENNESLSAFFQVILAQYGHGLGIDAERHNYFAARLSNIIRFQRMFTRVQRSLLRILIWHEAAKWQKANSRKYSQAHGQLLEITGASKTSNR